MIHGGANARDSSGDAIVVGDSVRADEMATVLFDCEEIASPIGEVDSVTSHGRRSRNIAAGCEHPFWCQWFDVIRTDGMLCCRVPGFVQIVSCASPLARPGLDLC